MEREIYAVVMIDNENYVQSHTFACLKDIKGVKGIFCDNSKNNYANFMVEHLGFKYLPTDSSKDYEFAFGEAIKYIETVKDGNPIICVFDKQTDIKPDFFERIAKEYQDGEMLFPALYINGKTFLGKGEITEGLTIDFETAKKIFIEGQPKAKTRKINSISIDRVKKDLTPEQIEWNRRFSW